MNIFAQQAQSEKTRKTAENVTSILRAMEGVKEQLSEVRKELKAVREQLKKKEDK